MIMSQAIIVLLIVYPCRTTVICRVFCLSTSNALNYIPVRPSVFQPVNKPGQLVILCCENLLQLPWYVDHILKLCKTLFSTPYSLWFNGYLPLSLKFCFCWITSFCQSADGGIDLSQISPGFYMSAVQVFWKQCGKWRNCWWQAISSFPTVFSTRLDNFLLKLFHQTCFCCLQTLSVWTSPKYCPLLKG